jgi:DNA primase
MKYPKEYLDEIKTRLKVSTVVSKSVAPKEKGQRISWVYLLLKLKKPHHSPLTMRKDFYHCFSNLQSTEIFLIL